MFGNAVEVLNRLQFEMRARYEMYQFNVDEEQVEHLLNLFHLGEGAGYFNAFAGMSQLYFGKHFGYSTLIMTHIDVNCQIPPKCHLLHSARLICIADFRTSLAKKFQVARLAQELVDNLSRDALVLLAERDVACVVCNEIGGTLGLRDTLKDVMGCLLAHDNLDPLLDDARFMSCNFVNRVP